MSGSGWLLGGLRHDRWLFLGGLALIQLAAAIYTVAGIGMKMSAIEMTRMARPPGQPMDMGADFVWSVPYATLIFLMWWIMMIAMMVPSAAATFAVAAFTHESRGALRVEICGPEALTGDEIAERFSRALGRAIRFRPMPPREFGGIIDGVFGGGGDEVAAFYEAVQADHELLSTRIDHAALLAKLAIAPTMEDFARRHMETFGGGPA